MVHRASSLQALRLEKRGATYRQYFPTGLSSRLMPLLREGRQWRYLCALRHFSVHWPAYSVSLREKVGVVAPVAEAS